MNEIWNARREKLEAAVVKAVLDLFEHTVEAAAFKLLIKGTKPEVFIVVGDLRAIRSLLQEPDEASLAGTSPIICEGCGGEINVDYGKCRRC